MNNINDAEINFLSIIMNKNDVIDMTVVKPEFIENKSFRELYRIILELQEFNPPKIVEKGFNDVDLMTFVYEQFIYESTYHNMFKHYELIIINHYKTKLLNNLNTRLSKREISYSDYKTEFDKIDSIRQINTKEHPNQKEIVSIITKKNKYIQLGKFEDLAKALRLLSDDTVTVAGPTGFGKSAMLLNLFNECINDRSNYCQYYNLEINNEQVVKRLIAINSKERILDINKNIQKENVAKSIKKFSNEDYYLFNEPLSLERLTAEITSHLKSDKQNIVFVDYIGLLNVEDKEINRTQYTKITHIMKELRKLCRKYNILMFLISQCERDSLKKEKITLHSLKDSGEVENSSTHVILLYDSENEEVDFDFCENVIVDVAKNRNNYTHKMEINFFKNKQLFEEKGNRRDLRVWHIDKR